MVREEFGKHKGVLQTKDEGFMVDLIAEESKPCALISPKQLDTWML